MVGWLFSWLLTVVGVGYGWIDPFIGLMAYYALTSLRPPYTWFWAFDGSFPKQIQWAALATLAGWVITGFGSTKGLKYVKWPMLGLAVYLASGTLAWQFFCINATVAWDALSVQLKIGLMTLVTLMLVTSEMRIKAFTWLIVGSLCYLAESFNEWYARLPLYLWSHGWGGVDNNGVAMIMVMGVPLAFFLMLNPAKLRPLHRWILAAVLALVAVNSTATSGKVGLVIGVCSVAATVLLLTTETWGVRVACFLGVGCLVHVVLFSYSRGGQVGLIMVGTLLFIFALVSLPRKMLTITLALVAVFLSLQLAGAQVRARFMTIMPFLGEPGQREASAESRFSTWAGGWACIQDHPFGVGPRNFNLISDHYGLPYNKSIHNLFLQTGADYGIPGMIGLFVFYVGTFVQCYITSLHPVARRLVWPRYYCQMVSISLAGMLVCSQFIGMESVETGFMVAIIGMVTVAHVRRIAEAEAQVSPEALPELRQAVRSELVPSM